MTGPRPQLALAILAEVTGDDALAVRLHQDFKRDVIAGLAMNRSWQMNERQVREWLSIRAGELDGAEHVRAGGDTVRG